MLRNCACGKHAYAAAYAYAKKSVRSCINTLRASSVRRNIQHRDMLFKTGDARRFRLPNNSASVCGRLLTESGFTTDPQEIVSEFSEYFKQVFSSRVDSALSEEMLTNARERSYDLGPVDDILAKPITPQEVSAAVEGLKRGKSPGPDGLLAEHIRHGGSILIPWLTGVFNRILAVEEIPSCMKLGQIVPVYKRKGKDPASASSYRGITISSCFPYSK